MRTRTIYQALDCVRESSAFFATEKRVRQAGTFERELLRRMDERDALVAREHAPPDIRITAINGLRQNTSMPVKISFKGANE